MTDRLYKDDRIGNYRIEIELANGPVFAEYRAVHLVLPRRAVIKLMHPAADQPVAVHMLREACLLDALHHPGVVRIYESGIHDHRSWCATELIDGQSVKQLLSPGPLDRADAATVLRDVAEILEHAHHRGIIHCGLRPDRIVMTGRSRGFPLCISDWSDARAHDAKRPPLVPDAIARHYTAPELLCGDPIDDRTDMFSLGVIAYQLLTGGLPFEGGIAASDDGVPQHVPTELGCAEAPLELARLIDSMIAYDRWDRPSSDEVLAELGWLADALTTPPAARRPASGLRIRRPRWTPMLPPRGADDGGVTERVQVDDDLTVPNEQPE